MFFIHISSSKKHLKSGSVVEKRHGRPVPDGRSGQTAHARATMHGQLPGPGGVECFSRLVDVGHVQPLKLAIDVTVVWNAASSRTCV